MKVGFATADWSHTVLEEDETRAMGGSGWIRIGQYSPFLEIDHVIGTLVFHKEAGIFGVTASNGQHHLDCDVVYMQRWMLSDIPDNIRRAQSAGQIIVNDLDDWYWGLHERHFAKNYIDPRYSKDENTNFYRDVLRLSDLVVVSTPFLADAAKNRLGVANVVMLENCVDFDAYGKQRKHIEGITTIGWHGSTGHRSGDLDILRNVCPNLDPERFAFHHTGHTGQSPAFWDEIGVEKNRVTLYPLVSPLKIPLMLPFDIGIAPLNDLPFNHAKSWIKPLEYIAAGIPFVASKGREYKRLRDRYGVGRLANKMIDWRKHFNALSNPEVRQSEALANREAVQSLDVRHGALRLKKILESIT